MGCLPALVWILCQRAFGQVIENGRAERLQLRNWRRFGTQNGGDDARSAFACERLAAGEHFVEHRSQAENVGARVRLFTLQLLWAHIL